MHRWLEANGHKPGVTFPASTLHMLAARWWGTRLDPEWQPRSVEESQAILDGVGLVGEFWTLP